ncbi:MAG: hypothetical protein KGL39_38915 [Patescibacteria group bacterium]|nr:hypothetical protein [Patescibacteria group bacterium]
MSSSSYILTEKKDYVSPAEASRRLAVSDIHPFLHLLPKRDGPVAVYGGARGRVVGWRCTTFEKFMDSLPEKDGQWLTKKECAKILGLEKFKLLLSFKLIPPSTVKFFKNVGRLRVVPGDKVRYWIGKKLPPEYRKLLYDKNKVQNQILQKEREKFEAKFGVVEHPPIEKNSIGDPRFGKLRRIVEVVHARKPEAGSLVFTRAELKKIDKITEGTIFHDPDFLDFFVDRTRSIMSLKESPGYLNEKELLELSKTIKNRSLSMLSGDTQFFNTRLHQYDLAHRILREIYEIESKEIDTKFLYTRLSERLGAEEY